MSFLVYKSSAGSGKTFTLVREYLQLALGSSNPMAFSHILAITFTNKAANEMTDRILETLEEMSGVVAPMKSRTYDLMQLLMGDLNVEEADLKLRARRTLKKIVHNYHNFSVGTIDSFVHKIIRSFATEMGLNQQFEVELNTDNVLRRAVDQMLERVGVDKVLTKFIEQYVDEKFDDGKTWKVDEDLYNFARGLLNSHEWYYLEKAKSINLKSYAERYKKLQKEVRGYEAELTRISKTALEFALNGLEQNQYASRGVILGYFKKIVSKDFTPKLGVTILKLLEDDSKKWYAAKCSASEKSVIEECKTQLKTWLLEIVAIRKEKEGAYLQNKLLYTNIYRVALLAEVDKEVQKIKKENDLILISDFTELVGKVTRNEPVPFIYEKLGEKYSHFLFDEFQDTSLMQWHNMLPLVENSLSQGGTSLVVGDAKQSIYRWRGGVVEQFSDLPKAYNPYNDAYVKERESSLITSYKKPDTLNKNFRSKANIVNFNNLFFEKAASIHEESVGEYYEDVKQETKDPSRHGYVAFNFYHEKTKEELQSEIFERITEIIRETVADGYSLKDIAILSKSKKNTPALVEHLSTQEINVISSESLLVNNSVAVQLIVSTLNHLNQPNEPFFMSETLIRFHALAPKLDFHQKMANSKGMQEKQFQQTLLEWGILLKRSSILSLPLYEMVSAIIELFGLNHSQDNRLAAWMDYVFNFSLKAGRGLFDLLDDWKAQQSKLSIQIPEDVDAVNVMTIHKSKGLDWPVVILAEGNWPEVHKSHTFWAELPPEGVIPVAILPHNKILSETIFKAPYEVEKKRVLLDNLNAMYVAFTRPADRLYVMSIKPETTFFKDLYGIITDLQGHELVYAEEEEIKGKSKLKFLAYGKKENKVQSSSDEGSKVDLIKIKNHKNSAYRTKLKVKKNYLKWLDNAGQREFGNVVHKAFSFIDEESDLSAAIKRLISLGDILPEEASEIENLIQNVIQHPEVSPYFKTGLEVKSEAEIILANGDLLRPDRVVITPSEAVVIDFKTGMRKPAHDQQILAYKTQLLEMGYPSVKAILIYTQEVMVVEV